MHSVLLNLCQHAISSSHVLLSLVLNLISNGRAIWFDSTSDIKCFLLKDQKKISQGGPAWSK